MSELVKIKFNSVGWPEKTLIVESLIEDFENSMYKKDFQPSNDNNCDFYYNDSLNPLDEPVFKNLKVIGKYVSFTPSFAFGKNGEEEKMLLVDFYNCSAPTGVGVIGDSIYFQDGSMLPNKPDWFEDVEMGFEYSMHKFEDIDWNNLSKYL